jgi:hypothetical protein
MDHLCPAIAASNITYLNVSKSVAGANGAEQVADMLKDNGTLTTLDISMNKLTRGALKSKYSGNADWHYETDMAGMTTPELLKSAPLYHVSLQVLSPLPMPSLIWGPYPLQM